MSDWLSGAQIAEPEEEQVAPSKWLAGARMEGPRQPFDLARADGRYHFIIQKMVEANRRRETDEDLGSLPDEIRSLVYELSEAWGVPETQITQALVGDMQQLGQMPDDPASLRFAQNVLGAMAGVFEPLLAAGDFTRTFTSELAMVQGERDAREFFLEHGFMPDLEDPSLWQGSPASNPVQALQEMGQAAGRAVTRMGEGEGGYWVYAPSLSWGDWRFGVAPYEAGGATRGADIVRQFGLHERFGLDQGGIEALGLVLEVAMDPYMVADVAFGFAKGMRAVAARTGNQAMTRNAVALERMSNHVYRTLSPRGMLGLGVDVLKTGTLGAMGYWDDIITLAQRGIHRVLDTPAPAAFLRQSQRTAMGQLGIPIERPLQERAMAPTWGEVFGQRGRFEWLGSSLPEWMTGSEAFGLSGAELAMGYRNQIRTVSMRATRDIADVLTAGLPTQRFTLRFPWARVAIPGTRTVVPELQGYVRGVNKAVRDWLDTAGVFVDPRTDQAMMRRLRAISDTYGIPLENTLERFSNATSIGRHALLQIGYETSGYRTYIEAMRRAADDLGLNYSDVRRAYEGLSHGNVDPLWDLQTLEARGAFSTVKRDPVKGISTGAVAADTPAMLRAERIQTGWQMKPETLDDFVDALQRHLTSMGASDLRGITPDRFLEGIRDGWLMRQFLAVSEPTRSLEAVTRRAVIPMNQVDVAPTAQLFAREFNDPDVGRVVGQYLKGVTPSRPRGMPADMPLALSFNSEDLARILSQKVGRAVTPDDVANIVLRHDPNYATMQDTLRTLEEYNKMRPMAGLGGAEYGQIPSAFTRREDLTAERLVQLLQIEDTPRLIATAGHRGARQLQSQEFLGMAWERLNADGLIVPAERVLPSNQNLRQDAFKPFVADGVKWAVFPNDARVWGPFAGQAAPEPIVRHMVHALTHSARDARRAEQMFSMWRQMLISPLPTSFRNVVGNLILMQQAGLGLSDMITALPRAHRLRAHYLEHGRLPDPFQGYEHMFQFVQDSGIAKNAIRHMSDTLEDIASGKTRFDEVLQGGRQAVDWITGADSPHGNLLTMSLTAGGTGALGLFRYGEEVTRTAAFLTTYDTMIRMGKNHADAVARAAHMATNAAYNYGALPLGPDLLKRFGLSAFPQFAYFSAGRTVRAMFENPAAPLRWDYARRLANTLATDGDLSEQEKLTAAASHWQRYSNPTVIPIPGEDGRWYMFDAQYFFPQGANVMDTLMDPFLANWMTPAIDAVWALAADKGGTGPFSVKYGMRVFDPSKEPLERVGQAAAFAVTSYLFPGVTRSYQQAFGEDGLLEYKGLPGGAFGFEGREEQLDLWAWSQARFVNSDPIQFWARRFGFNLRKVSTRVEDPSFSAGLSRLTSKHTPGIAAARQAWQRELFVNGETPRERELRMRYFELEERAREELLDLITIFVR